MDRKRLHRHLHWRVLEAVDRAWRRGEPLSKRPADGARFVGQVLADGSARRATMVGTEARAALAAREIVEEVIGWRPMKFGLRLAARLPRTLDGDAAEMSRKHPARLRREKPKSMKSLAETSGGDAGGDAAETRLQHQTSPTKKRKHMRSFSDFGGDDRQRRQESPPLLLKEEGRALARAGLNPPRARPLPDVHAEVGDRIVSRGQTFICVGSTSHVRRGSTKTTLAVWQSACAECGAIFTFKGAASDFRDPRRRCDAHKAPGVWTHLAIASGKWHGRPPVKPRSAQ